MRWKSLFAFAVALAVATPLLAGERYKCTASTQKCLDMLVAHYRDTGFIGVDGAEEKDGYRITRVMPDGPAAEAGLKFGDKITAMNGVTLPAEDEEKWAAVQKKKKPGVRFALTILRDGKEREVTVTLALWPEDAIATTIGYHMLQHFTEPSGESGKKQGG